MPKKGDSISTPIAMLHYNKLLLAYIVGKYQKAAWLPIFLHVTQVQHARTRASYLSGLISCQDRMLS